MLTGSPLLDSADFNFLGNDGLLVVANDLKLYSIEDISGRHMFSVTFPGGEHRVYLPTEHNYSSQQQPQAQYTEDPKHRLLCLALTNRMILFISTCSRF